MIWPAFCHFELVEPHSFSENGLKYVGLVQRVVRAFLLWTILDNDVSRIFVLALDTVVM